MDRRLLAIDPGNERSAWLVWDDRPSYGLAPAEPTPIVRHGIDVNDDLLSMIRARRSTGHVNAHRLVVEMIGHYGTGMPAGKTIFDTCVWIGRFVEAWGDDSSVTLILRPTVKAHICGTARAKDPNIRQALIDRFGKDATRGVKKDIWSALAVAVTFADQSKREVA